MLLIYSLGFLKSMSSDFCDLVTLIASLIDTLVYIALEMVSLIYFRESVEIVIFNEMI